jgi:hypothetical protein
VEQWEEEKGMETILPPQKIIKYRIQREIKKMVTQFWTPKKKINDTKEPKDVHKNILKEEILQVITENFMEILDMANQNVQEALKKFQDTKNKEYEKTQKEINELIGALHKNQSETENTINREINGLKMKIDIISHFFNKISDKGKRGPAWN